jgi:hypothetical protein|tara:strand:- start:112 stop:333 length:222 start_codon:yes stop_codon:yes gene_type:complete
VLNALSILEPDFTAVMETVDRCKVQGKLNDLPSLEFRDKHVVAGADCGGPASPEKIETLDFWSTHPIAAAALP